MYQLVQEAVTFYKGHAEILQETLNCLQKINLYFLNLLIKFKYFV